MAHDKLLLTKSYLQDSTMDLSKKGLGPSPILMLSAVLATTSSAVVTRVDISNNPYGIDGANALASALPESKIQSLVIGSESTELAPTPSVDLSKQAFGPAEIIIVAAWLSTPATAAVESVDLSKNFITAPISRDGDNTAPWTSYDTDLSGLEALCDALSSSGITSVNLAENLFGAKAISTLSTQVTWSTAAVESVDISGNEQMGAEAGAMLAKVMPDSNIKSFKFGKSAEISTEKCEATVLDFSSQNFGPGEVIVISWWLSTPATAAVTSVDLSGNLISGSKYNFDADVTGIEALAAIKVETLILRECAFGPKAITALSSTLSTAAVERVDLSNNKFDPSIIDDELKTKVDFQLDGCKP